MATVIRFSETGGPEVLRAEKTDLPAPGHGEVRLAQTAVGVDFIDTYHRSGLYPVSPPSGLGGEAAGIVAAVGPDVTDFKPGDRAVYCLLGQPGAYASHRIVPADAVIPLPDDISEETAAAVFLKGLTAYYLLHRTHRVAEGETILVHAAAGGVGSLLVPWAKALGATVIGTVGSEEKAERAKRLGCDHPIIYTQEDFAERVRAITNDTGVPVVYDSVGKATFDGSLDCLAPLGLMISFGNSSGAVPPVSPGVLAQKGSLFLTRPSLVHYIAEPADYRDAAAALFARLADGTLDVHIDAVLPLHQAGEAHRRLESRETQGSLILRPEPE